MLVQQNKISYDVLDKDIYITTPQNYEKNKDIAKILHAAGQPKFWNGLQNEQWNTYYNTWVKEYNGMPYKKKRKSLKRILNWFLPYGFVKLLERLKT